MPDVTYRVVVEYDGTDFNGLQYLPGLRTIAGELETALSRLFDRAIKITAAGRTDAGVHATGQVISFAGHDAFPVERLAIALNSALPPDVSARDAVRAEPRFSARLSAIGCAKIPPATGDRNLEKREKGGRQIFCPLTL